MVANGLVRWAAVWEVQEPWLCHCVVSKEDRKTDPRVSSSTQEYKWVPSSCQGSPHSWQNTTTFGWTLFVCLTIGSLLMWITMLRLQDCQSSSGDEVDCLSVAICSMFVRCYWCISYQRATNSNTLTIDLIAWWRQAVLQLKRRDQHQKWLYHETNEQSSSPILHYDEQ